LYRPMVSLVHQSARGLVVEIRLLEEWQIAPKGEKMTTGEPNNTSEAWGNWRSRFWAHGVDPNDVETALSRITVWEDWYREWSRMAEDHEKFGDEALAAGRTITAADAFFRSCICYHFAHFMWDRNPAEKEEGARKKVAVFHKGAPYYSPPTLPVEIPFDNTGMPGYFRMATPVPGPCVVLLPGSDSSKEQQFRIEAEFLRRGVSTLSIDGPGQGIYRYTMPLRLDYEKAVSAAVDWLQAGGKVDGDRIAVAGNSLGGYFALRAAAFDTRLKAAVTMGGTYDMGSRWETRSAMSKDSQTFLFGKSSWEEAAEFAKGISLKGVLHRVKCPTLIVHGAKDKVCPVSEAYQMAREIPHARLEVFAEGNHVCNNLPYLYRPLVADWVKETLG
jgi:pimeloyl-ACP methyl ester carboxylesterase